MKFFKKREKVLTYDQIRYLLNRYHSLAAKTLRYELSPEVDATRFLIDDLIKIEKKIDELTLDYDFVRIGSKTVEHELYTYSKGKLTLFDEPKNVLSCLKSYLSNLEHYENYVLIQHRVNSGLYRVVSPLQHSTSVKKNNLVVI